MMRSRQARSRSTLLRLDEQDHNNTPKPRRLVSVMISSGPCPLIPESSTLTKEHQYTCRSGVDTENAALLVDSLHKYLGSCRIVVSTAPQQTHVELIRR